MIGGLAARAFRIAVSMLVTGGLPDCITEPCSPAIVAILHNLF
jgi:hypothetical protein